LNIENSFGQSELSMFRLATLKDIGKRPGSISYDRVKPRSTIKHSCREALEVPQYGNSKIINAQCSTLNVQLKNPNFGAGIVNIKTKTSASVPLKVVL
jgi:hypothetical protein